MERFNEQDLCEIIAVATKEEYEARIGNVDDVELSVMLNAHAAGFYAAARFVEKPRSLIHGLPLREKVRPLHPLFDRSRANQAASQYIKKHFLGMKPQDEAMIRSSFGRGFARGGKFIWEALSNGT